MKLLEAIFRPFIILGSVQIIIGYFMSISKTTLEKAASGENLIYVSVLLIVLTIAWQAKGLYSFFRNPLKKNRYKQVVYLLTIGIGLLTIVWWASSYLVYHLIGEGELYKFLSRYYLNMGIEGSGFSIWRFVGGLFAATVIGSALAAAIFCVLMFGRLGFGLSISLAFHNWANGMRFDFSLFYEIMIGFISETGLNDPLAPPL
jgi:hypothetical protein